MADTKRSLRFKLSLLGVLLVLVFMAVFLVRSGLFGARSESTLRIGAVLPTSGETADWGLAAYRGVELAVQHLRRDLGINIELLPVEDNRGNPAASAEAVRRLVSLRGANAIVGPITSANSRAAAVVADELSVPLVSPAATAASLTLESRFAFRACYVDDFQGRVLADFAFDDLGARRAAVVADPRDAYSQGLSGVFVTRFRARGGNVQEIPIALSDREFGPQIASLRSGRQPQVIFMAGRYPETASFVRQLRATGASVSVLAGDAVDSPEFFALAREAAIGVYVTSHFSDQAAGRVATAFLQDFQARFGQRPNVAAALAYDATLLIGHGFANKGRGSLRDAMVALRNIEGVTGRIDMSDTRNPIKSVVVLRAGSGRFEFVKRIDPQ